MFGDIFGRRKNKELISKLEEENNFLYELLEDDNLCNYDAKMKVSRLNLIYTLQNILIAKMKSETAIEINKEIGKLVDAETDYKKQTELIASKATASLRLEISKLSDKIHELNIQKSTLENETTELMNNIEEKKAKLIEFDDEILYQDFGLYTPIYNLMNSKMYKERIVLCRNKQKAMVKAKKAAISDLNWTVNDSIREGEKMTNRNLQLIVRCFNNECDELISKVKFNNYDSIKKRIHRSYETLNDLNTVIKISINKEYLDLKIEELSLCYEYEQKKAQEKEDLKAAREAKREQAKLLKEIEAARKKIKKEQEHFNLQLRRLDEQIEIEPSGSRLNFLIEKKTLVENNLLDLDKALKDVDYREANQKAGYVYIISNIGAFGENIYKIGMTRRLNPQERIDELGGASVPFKFDVHAMIFSKDAPALEASLHRAFDAKKVNMANNRKEFFKVSLDEIKKVVTENYDRTVDFLDVPPAQQYRETLKLIKERDKKPF